MAGGFGGERDFMTLLPVGGGVRGFGDGGREEMTDLAIGDVDAVGDRG